MNEKSEAEVGTVAEEAAKLLGALQDWAKETGAGQATAAAAAAAAVGERVQEVGERIGTDGQECPYCPVCQLIHRFRETNPDVRTHLADAARSLLHAAAAVLDTKVPTSDREPHGLQKIQLEDQPPEPAGDR